MLKINQDNSQHAGLHVSNLTIRRKVGEIAYRDLGGVMRTKQCDLWLENDTRSHLS